MSSEFGPLPNPRLSIFVLGDMIEYKWQVWFHTIASGKYSFEAVQQYLDQLQTNEYQLCPGINKYPSTEVRFKTKRLREWGLPFNRVDSIDCLLWHFPNNGKYPHGDPLRDA